MAANIGRRRCGHGYRATAVTVAAELVGWLNEGDGAGSVTSPAILQMLNDMQPTTRLERAVKGKRLKQFQLPDSTGVLDATVLKVLNVFVTGATGAVAAVVVDELLKLELNDIGVEVHVTCLVRGDSDEAATTRLLNQIASVRGFGSDSNCTGAGRHLDARVQELAEEVQRGRVSVVRGNIAQEKFGLSDHKFTRLALDADVILHSSAAVNHVHPYSWHREANTVATQRVLEFAASTGKDYFTPLHFISSSNVVFGNRGGISSVAANTDVDQNLLEGTDLSTGENLLERADLFSALAAVERAGETGTATLTPMGNWLLSLPNGYMQSKFVSEGLCRNTIKLLAKQAGGTLPLNDSRAALTVYRPGILTSHRQTGFSKVDDLYPRLLMAMRSLKIYPTIPDTARYEMTPNTSLLKPLWQCW
jgi:thioester reductase-like protein